MHCLVKKTFLFTLVTVKSKLLIGNTHDYRIFNKYYL